MKRFACMMLVVLLCCAAGHAMANTKMQKAIKHFKEFEMKQAVTVLKELEKDSSLGDKAQAKVALYLGMSHVYLRKRDDALTYFKRALRLDPSIALPAGRPPRMKRLFQTAREGVGAPTTPVRSAPVRPAPAQPTPVRSAPAQPTPAVRPPPRRRISFGSFAIGPTTTRRKAPPPRRRISFGTITMRPRPRPRPVVMPEPRLRREPTPRRVATKRTSPELDPELTRELNKNKKKPTGRGAAFTMAWVSVGLAVALAGGGAVAGVMAQSKVDLAKKDSVFQADIPSIESDAQTRALAANAMYIGAGVAGLSAVIFFIVSASGKSSPKARAGLNIPRGRNHDRAEKRAGQRVSAAGAYGLPSLLFTRREHLGAAQ